MSKIIKNIPEHASIGVTPSTPTTGYSKIYPKSDKKWYILDDTGLEKPIGGSISGTLNYIPKWTPDGETIGLSQIIDSGTEVRVTLLQGTGDRMVEADSNGSITATRNLILTYAVPNTEKLKLENSGNWDVNGVYIGTAITGTYQGQKHYDDNYLYEAVGDNIFIRLIRG